MGLFSSGSDQKAMLLIETASGSTTTFQCQFNPDEFQINTEGKFTTIERKGESDPIVQYMGGTASSLDLVLYFDTSTSYEIKSGLFSAPTKEQAKDVSAYVDDLLNMVRVDGKLHRPPVVVFSWGSVRFGGMAKNVSARFTMFEKGGMPVRAEVRIHLVNTAMEELGQMKLSPKESPDRSKCIVLTEDTSLWSIAEKEYGDGSKWREIARANNILDPLAVAPGTQLRVPALT